MWMLPDQVDVAVVRRWYTDMVLFVFVSAKHKTDGKAEAIDQARNEKGETKT